MQRRDRPPLRAGSGGERTAPVGPPTPIDQLETRKDAQR